MSRKIADIILFFTQGIILTLGAIFYLLASLVIFILIAGFVRTLADPQLSNNFLNSQIHPYNFWASIIIGLVFSIHATHLAFEGIQHFGESHEEPYEPEYSI